MIVANKIYKHIVHSYFILIHTNPRRMSRNSKVYFFFFFLCSIYVFNTGYYPKVKKNQCCLLFFGFSNRLLNVDFFLFIFVSIYWVARSCGQPHQPVIWLSVVLFCLSFRIKSTFDRQYIRQPFVNLGVLEGLQYISTQPPPFLATALSL